MNAINHESAIPYYIQVKDVIRAKMRSGVWKVNDQLPSEAELCDAFAVSRTVIRQALQDLIHEGLIVRRKGKGSFVAAKKISEHLVQKLTGFYQDMVDQGFQPVTQVLSQAVVPADQTIAHHLAVPPGTSVIEIVRLRSVQESPIVAVTTYLPYQLVPNLLDDDLSNQSLYALLERNYNIQIVHGRRSIQAVPADSTLATLLDVHEGAPLFRLDSVSYVSDGTPVEYYFAYHRGDRSQFEVELIRTREPDQIPILNDLPRSNTFTDDLA